ALGEQIGQGAMGIVYRGRDTRTGQPVAIKTVEAQTVKENPTILERFQREGEILRRLRHPNIVTYLATAEREGQYYLVMEYVSGGDLRQLVKTEKPIALRQILTIALDVADALARTHRLNILHRDLKPSNILLNEDGLPKLSDFGLAHLNDGVEITQHGTVVGTIAYLSPEACEGRPLDQRSDIWSFGVLLYELLTGQRPFVGTVTSAVLLEIMTKPLPNIGKIRPDIPTELQQLLVDMLQKEPAERIHSVRHVGAVLETMLRSEDGHQLAQRFPVTQPIHLRDTPIDHYAPTVFNVRLPSTIGALEALAIRTTFVGRVAEMSTIIQTLNRPTCRVLTLIGAGGVGKTRLAVKVARAFMTQTGQTAHFTSLIGIRTVQQLLQSLITALDVPLDNPSTPYETALFKLVDALQTRPLLLVFDHAESILHSDREAFLALINNLSEQLPHLRLLITSRQRLKIQREWVFKVQGLSVPMAGNDAINPQTAVQYDAVALFKQRARQADATFELTPHNTGAVVQLCQQLEGLPLGIELAAAQLQQKTISEINDELLALHTNLQADLEEIPFHHRSLAAVFEQSWHLLNQTEQETLSHTAVFRGGFSRAAAFAVLGKQVAHFDSLLERSLLMRHYTPTGLTRVRYTLPQLLRKHLLIAHPPPYQVYRQHADYYLQWAVAHQDALSSELDNVTAAWEWARTQSSFTPPR
ncbi:MAG: protein kinase, partial [Anaerolineales bacterium]|nr:protein kinase [Anaerolineales bacterium]